jgi:predicted acetyltransferase
MEIAVDPAPVTEKRVIERLLEFYIYDFSEFMGWNVDRRGRFGYRYLDHYWTEDNRFPFLVRVDGAIAGFALVTVLDEDGAPVTHMSEFFVMRRYRRHGVGRIVAATLFDRFPGQWHIQQILANVPAQVFWRSVIGSYTDGDYTESTTDRHLVQTFRAAHSGGTSLSGSRARSDG